MKTLILAAICIVLAGCSPLHIYHGKMQRLQEHKNTLKAQNLSGLEMRRLYYEEVKKEFPDYSLNVELVLSSIKRLQDLERRQAVEQFEVDILNRRENDLWSQIYQDTRLREQSYLSSLNMLSDSLGKSAEQLRQTERDINNTYRTKPLNCTSQIRNGTVYSTCY